MLLKMEAVTTVYGSGTSKVTALRDINLSVGKGEYISIIGPSGSGKSTFLLTLAGLIHPTEGKVYIDGRSIYDLTVTERAKIRRHTLGFMFQTFNLIPYLTALENVQVPLCIADRPDKEQVNTATELLNKVGLENRMSHRPSELSVGERQRVALARAIANKPSIILADEPTGNLDPGCSEEVFDYFSQLHREGMTIVVVTHDHNAAQYTDRQVEILDGRLREKEKQKCIST